ncbi:BON domain-containing protein [Rhizobium binae]|uniref:Osmotically-inducible protein OsmY n=1 Tax=Rhizobium binae TaxID=1138190 RepID=A0ABV2MHD8_9HYPH|nr:BON domain-containing protein [Rhizobium binae]NKL48545.1 BON domain-containing protein [Rhizobium leguminosarum bv. viciae]MBX4927892.1 BON domain-containing protein [Rhizobium binae]MBX4938450.1 BON domain-containing protein [Rhizobium binae]MBX4944957.1 BON domain-containing protein [Rhizobium binae]MBX4952138.1 BON domain-containing protein [Rhizobium binae]
MNDTTIYQDVLDELDFEPSIDAANIGVAVENGIVTLSGHVESYAEKAAAEAAARRVRGVRAIAEEIQVRYPERKKHADDEIAARALKIISWDTALPDGAIGVTVQHGCVKLTGEVPWHFQRIAAENAVKKLGGVVAVANLVTIRPAASASDIRQRIENALRRNAEIEASGIKANVTGGDVTLQGDVHSWNERRAAEQAAWSVPGVTRVDNRIAVT